MHLNRLLLLAMLAIAPIASRAQITLTQADLLEQITFEGTSTAFETGPSTALTALAEAEGAGRTWDFTGLTYGPALVATSAVVEPPVIGSDDPHFADADFILESTDAGSDSSAYSFFNIDEDGLTFLGLAALGEDGEGQTGIVELKYLPGSRIFEFPLTFGTAWTSEYEVEFVPVIEQLLTESRDEVEVVGWGTLVTPAGSAEALMVRTKTVSTVTVVSTDPDTSFVVGMDSLYNINFVTRDNVSAGITLDGLGNAESGSYSVATESGTAADPDALGETPFLAAAYPNPVRRNSEVAVDFTTATSGKVRVEIFDVLGRAVSTVLDEARPAGPQRTTWQVDGLPAGLYLVRIAADGRTATRRVSVVN